jgi:hypothetical protein
MPNYQNSKIYTIRCKDDNSLIYVGSTTQSLSKRMVEHRSKHNKTTGDTFTKPLYMKMREVGIDKFYIELYEDYPCDRKEHLEKREGEIIREIGNLNRVIAGVRYRENTEEYNKEYYRNNKEILDNKNKEYRELHKEEIKEKNRIKYQANKTKINEKGIEKITCDCGCSFRRDGLYQHNKTTSHMNWFNSRLIVQN